MLSFVLVLYQVVCILDSCLLAIMQHFVETATIGYRKMTRSSLSYTEVFQYMMNSVSSAKSSVQPCS